MKQIQKTIATIIALLLFAAGLHADLPEVPGSVETLDEARAWYEAVEAVKDVDNWVEHHHAAWRANWFSTTARDAALLAEAALDTIRAEADANPEADIVDDSAWLLLMAWATHNRGAHSADAQRIGAAIATDALRGRNSYLTYLAPADFVRATIAEGYLISPHVITYVANRLNDQTIGDGFFSSMLGTGEMGEHYLHWFQSYVTALEPASALTVLRSELAGLRSLDPATDGLRDRRHHLRLLIEDTQLLID